MKRPTGKINEAASMMGRRSAQVRKAMWGEKEFVRKMRAWGKLGGRPKGSRKKKTKEDRNDLQTRQNLLVQIPVQRQALSGHPNPANDGTSKPANEN
jgi:hypothetical protein